MMTNDVVTRSLQLEQNGATQRREWRFERVGWSVIALLVAAGLAGLFGQGPLTHQSMSAPGGRLRVEYDRVAHHEAPTSLVVTVYAGASADTMVALSIDRAYLELVDVEHVLPEPAETRALLGAVEFRFRRPEGAPLRVSFALMPNELGTQHAVVRSGSAVLRLTQLVLP